MVGSERVDGAVTDAGQRREMGDAVAVLETLCERSVDGRRAVVPPCTVGDGVDRQGCGPVECVFVDLLDAVARVAVGEYRLDGLVGDDGV